MTNILFTPIRIKKMEVRNRFVRSATGDRLADGAGFVTDKQIGLFAELAAGGVGLIITGVTYIHPTGRSALTQSSIDRDECVPGLKRLTKAVHDQEAKVAVQLFHAGREAARYRNPLNEEAIGPSLIEGDPYFTGRYRPMTDGEIWEVVGAFGDAARRAREAGFDAVQVHGAHAYLPSQFLSPYTNRRSDGWGGGWKSASAFTGKFTKIFRRRSGMITLSS